MNQGHAVSLLKLIVYCYYHLDTMFISTSLIISSHLALEKLLVSSAGKYATGDEVYLVLALNLAVVCEVLKPIPPVYFLVPLLALYNKGHIVWNSQRYFIHSEEAFVSKNLDRLLNRIFDRSKHHPQLNQSLSRIFTRRKPRLRFFIKPVNIKLREEFGHKSSKLTELIDPITAQKPTRSFRCFEQHHVSFRHISHVHHTEPVILLCLRRAL